MTGMWNLNAPCVLGILIALLFHTKGMTFFFFGGGRGEVYLLVTVHLD